VRENFRNTETMMITGYATVKGAVTAVKAGADEYLSKPFTDEELFAAVHRSLDKLRMRRSARLPVEEPQKVSFGLIGKSEAMRKVMDSIKKSSSTSATVLIYGESGTGKELIARAIHYNSPRASAAFVPVNCGAIPEALLESELFGHVKGAFTGATGTRAGFFQTADGGTIFLDEISDTSMAMQTKLLRVLESKEVCMVGSSRPRGVDVRILAATNKDLFNLVKQGLFREDLYYRLNVININLPPLRERGDDVLLLVRHFAGKFAREYNQAAPGFSEEFLMALKNYGWPGNVRELENLVQRVVVMSDEKVIDVTDLPAHMRFTLPSGAGLRRTLQEVEAEHVRSVLESTGGNVSEAAAILGIDRKTLRSKLKK
jgi:DNA-binding NtrC family response regulator